MNEQTATKKMINFTVITTADDLVDDFNILHPLRVVFNKALKLVGGKGQEDQFSLTYNDVELTDLDRPISEHAAEQRWGRDVELELVPKPVVV